MKENLFCDLKGKNSFRRGIESYIMKEYPHSSIFFKFEVQYHGYPENIPHSS